MLDGFPFRSGQHVEKENHCHSVIKAINTTNGGHRRRGGEITESKSDKQSRPNIKNMLRINLGVRQRHAHGTRREIHQNAAGFHWRPESTNKPHLDPVRQIRTGFHITRVAALGLHGRVVRHHGQCIT